MKQTYVRYDKAVGKMYENLNIMIKNERFFNRELYMIGTRKLSNMIIGYLQEKNIVISGVIDNDKRKQGYEINGVTVYNPDILKKRDIDQVIVLIASSYQEEMIDQLEKMGYVNNKNILKVIDLPLLMNDYTFVNRNGYKMMSGKEIRNRQIEIMKYVKKICNENSINYYLAYGTLLGAVRHGGFIPWDDDVDIYVDGKDIDRLAELVNNSSRYQMITCRNNSHYLDQLPIIMDNNSVLDINMFPLQSSIGVWIDVFPLYGIPTGAQNVKEYANRIKTMEMDKWKYLYDEKKCHQYALDLDDFIGSYDFDKSEYTGCFLTSEFTADYLKIEYFRNKDYLMFEDEEFCVPACYREILSDLYGDYMKFPPKEKRKASHYYKAYYIHKDYTARDVNVKYWDDYYRNLDCIKSSPSDFARYITMMLSEDTLLVDLGCGTGGDSIYFANIGINVIAFDYSREIIDRLKGKCNNDNLQFRNENFIEYIGTEYINPDYFYCRFSLNDITEEEQSELIGMVYNQLKKDGYFFIEARSILDNLYGYGDEIDKNMYKYNKRIIRFIEMGEIKNELIENGFHIEYCEQERNLAIADNQNSIIIRIIAQK